MRPLMSIVLPIFALILVGYLCRKTKRLGPQGAAELNKMVVWLCLPCLLFKVTATASWSEIWQPGFILAFGGGALITFMLTVGWRLFQGQGLVTSSIDGLSAGYANTGYIGIPLCLLVFGEAGLQPALIASLIVVCAIFALALIGIEVGLQERANPLRVLPVVTLALMKNPLIVSPLLGAAWAAGGLGLPAAIIHFLDTLGAATSPCALVSLGLFLAEKRNPSPVSPWPLVAMKLVAQPVITAVLAVQVLALSPMWAKAAILLSALPTGTGPFMLAEYYKAEAAVTSRAILLSTLGSLVTLTLILAAIH